MVQPMDRVYCAIERFGSLLPYWVLCLKHNEKSVDMVVGQEAGTSL